MQIRPSKLIDLAGLRAKGITYHRTHLDRLIRAGKFARPVKIGANRNAWIEAEVDAYILDRIAERDAQREPTPTTGPAPAPTAPNETRPRGVQRRRADRDAEAGRQPREPYTPNVGALTHRGSIRAKLTGPEADR